MCLGNRDIVQYMPVHARFDENLLLMRRTHQVNHKDGQSIFQVRIGDAATVRAARKGNMS